MRSTARDRDRVGPNNNNNKKPCSVRWAPGGVGAPCIPPPEAPTRATCCSQGHWLPPQVCDAPRLDLLSLTEFEKMAVSGWFLPPASEVNYCYQKLTVAIWLKYLRSWSFHYLSKTAIFEPACAEYQVLARSTVYRWHQYGWHIKAS